MFGKKNAGRIAVLSTEETAFFCSQAAMILKSGLPLTDGLKSLCEEYQDGGPAAYRALSEALDQTGELAAALKTAPVLPEYAVQMIEIGAASGTLDDVLAGLADYYLRQQQIQDRLKSAVTYPAILTLLMGGVIAVLIFRVLPVFARVLDSMGAGGSRTGAAVTQLGVVLGGVAMGITVLILCAIVGLALALRSGRSGALVNGVFMHIAPMRRIVKTLSAERFASVMAMLIKSGYPLEDALLQVSALPADEETRSRILKARTLLMEGGSFAGAVAQAELFEPLHGRMLITASSAGMMDSMLEKLSDIYAERLDRAIQAGESLIEPALVALLAVVAGAVLLAVMVPLARMLAGIV